MNLFRTIFGSPSTQQSQSTSSSTGYGLNTSSSISGSEAQSQSQQGSQQGSQQTSQQAIAFAPLFAALFGGASNAAANAADQVPGLQGQAGQLFSGGLDFLKQLQGGPGTDYLNSRITGPDTAAQEQINTLGANLGDFFNQQLIPGITSQGVSTGTLGGARDAVARSLAAKEVSGQYAQGVSQILGTSQAQRDAAAVAAMGGQQAGAGTGLSALSSLYGLASGGAMAGLAPFLSLAQILGGPTVLTQQQGTSYGTSYGTSSSSDIAQAISNALGLSFDTSQSQSTGQGRGSTPGLWTQITQGLGAVGL